MKSLFSASLVFLAVLSGRVLAQDEDPQQPTPAAAGLNLRAFTNLGCYSNPGDMWDMGYYRFQSSGWCQPLCVRQQARYFAIVNGTNCFCGESAPPEDEQVSGNSCRSTCLGIDTQFCGGENFWQAYDSNYRNGDETGTIHITIPSQTWFGMTPTSSSASSGAVEQEIRVTTEVVASATTTASESSRAGSSGTNTAGIAAGVVVGVVGLGAIIGGVFFFMRRKKQKELDAERRRHEALTNFVTRGEKPPSTFSGSDSRLEPSVMFQRRQSDGSIADNQDYSRRILKVTNPDDR